TWTDEDAVPEFSTVGLILAVAIAGLGIALIVKRKK
ncbi:LPXTG cell wall anchor domain-containing protein, partial [Candidatus Woesearchaeota archaeon]|nr:LPXTG cell wall anchor domain-containing protein [Candidatus Woesearchaeota archaeon]MBD3249835.1 LPXTG cell wall anchor domain-containing protein [Candidatus Woesearchaeota archaeon]